MMVKCKLKHSVMMHFFYNAMEFIYSKLTSSCVNQHIGETINIQITPFWEMMYLGR